MFSSRCLDVINTKCATCPLELQIDRSRHLPAGSAVDRVGTQESAFSIRQRDQITAHAMHRIVFPIPQPLAYFDLGR